MYKFSKKDFYFSTVTGLITGFSAWRIFEYLKMPPVHFGKLVFTGCPYPSFAPCSHYQYQFPWIFLVLAVPILWILGVLLGYFLGKWFNFFNQFGKFAAIGFTNAAVDFGVLNLLIANTDISSGGWYSVFKAISFLCAIIPSYFWNKHWAFRLDAERSDADVARVFGNQGPVPAAQRDDNIGSGTLNTGTFKFAKFMSVAIVSIFINTGTASIIVNYVDPLGGLNVQIWANVGAVAGSAVALVFSFVGFKVAVFKK